MKLYIYEGVYNLTDNYHDGGSAVVITDSDEPLEVLRREATGSSEGELEFVGEPVVYDVDATREAVFIFPNAGCC